MYETIKNFIITESGMIVQFGIAVISICITLLTFIQVGKVKKGQEKYKNLIQIESTIEVLNELSFILEDIQGMGINDEILKNRIKVAGRRVVESRATMTAINNSLFGEKSQFAPIYKDSGYFTHDFFNDKIISAKHSIKIYCKRNNLLFENEEQIMHLFNVVLNNNANIEIISVSTNCSNDILEEINKSVPVPSNNIQDFVEDQERNKRRYIECKERVEQGISGKKRNLSKIKYYESTEFPLFHIVVVDNSLYWGLINYGKDDEKILQKRGYLEFPISNEFSQKILKKFEIIKKNCKEFF